MGKDCVRENSDVFKIGKKHLSLQAKFRKIKRRGTMSNMRLKEDNIEYVIFDKVMKSDS